MKKMWRIVVICCCLILVEEVEEAHGIITKREAQVEAQEEAVVGVAEPNLAALAGLHGLPGRQHTSI